jgi:uncharacterized membrane protein YebE (DUF533 family)
MKKVLLPLLIGGAFIAYILFKKKGVAVSASMEADIVEPEKKGLKNVLGDVLKTVGGAAAGFIAGRALSNKKQNEVNEVAATPTLDIQQSSIPIANKTFAGSIKTSLASSLTSKIKSIRTSNRNTLRTRNLKMIQ